MFGGCDEIFYLIHLKGLKRNQVSIIATQKSICILAQTFKLNSLSEFNEFHSLISSLPVTKKPSVLVDSTKYYPHVYRDNGVLNIHKKDIFQFEIGDFEKSELAGVVNASEKSFYLDSEMKVEIDVGTIKWLIIFDTKHQLGLLFYMIDFKTRAKNSFEALSNIKTLRYFKEPGNDEMYKIKVFENGVPKEGVSLYSIFRDCFGSTCDKINFLEAKPLQFHFLDQVSFGLNEDRESHCYNILRIPGDSNKDLERKYFSKNINHVYENSSVYAFSMNEGTILVSSNKSPKKLVSNFLATQIIFLYHRRFEHIVSDFMGNQSLRNSKISKSFIKGLKQIRKDMNISSYYVGVPISQYSEVQEVYNLTKLNSGLNYSEVKEAFNQAATLLMEEAAEESSERERRIGLILGVLGITGFISFIFDYLLISKNQKFIDTLDFPLNNLPFLLFIITFIFIWKFLNKKNND